MPFRLYSLLKGCWALWVGTTKKCLGSREYSKFPGPVVEIMISAGD